MRNLENDQVVRPKLLAIVGVEMRLVVRKAQVATAFLVVLPASIGPRRPVDVDVARGDASDFGVLAKSETYCAGNRC